MEKTLEQQIAEVKNESGQEISATLHMGTREHQNDAIAAIAMKKCKDLDFSHSLKRAMQEGGKKLYQEANLLIAERIAQGSNEADAKNFAHEAINNCTATAVAYNPAHFTLDVAAYDDSPAFVILDDGEKIKAVMITTPVGHSIDGLRKADSATNMELICRLGGNTIIDRSAPTAPRQYKTESVIAALPPSPLKAKLQEQKNNDFMHTGSYKIGNNPRHHGRIKLDDLLKESGMNPQTTKIHLLVASDGITDIANEKEHPFAAASQDYPSFNLVNSAFIAKAGLAPDTLPPNQVAEFIVEKLYREAKEQVGASTAEAITTAASQNGLRDNLGLLLIENLQQNKGEPLVAIICDAPGKSPARAAEIAAKAIGDKCAEHQKKFIKGKIQPQPTNFTDRPPQSGINGGAGGSL